MKTAVALWIGFWALIAAFLFWRNHKLYPELRIWAKAAKTSIDWLLLLSAAVWLPPMLVAWCVMWASRNIRRSSLRMTFAVFAGMFFSLLMMGAREILVVFAAFSVDLITGANGFIKWWRRYDRQEGTAQQEVAA